MTSGPPALSSPGSSPALFFASDYGTADEFVGVVHAVLHAHAPGVPVIDLSHEIPPFDVPAGAGLLVRCAPALGPGVVVAVVDPGVGSDRRGIAVSVAGRGTDGGVRPGASWLVGPDNGLLMPLAGALGGVREIRELDRAGAARRGWPAVPGARTFDGRDLFAPAAAHLVMGRDPALLGPEVDADVLVALPGAERRVHRDAEGGVTGVVQWVDRFGNVELDLGEEDLVGLPAGVGVRWSINAEVDARSGSVASEPASRGAASPPEARRVESFADLATGELGMLVDANGRVALVSGRGSAATELGHPPPGTTVRLRPIAP